MKTIRIYITLCLALMAWSMPARGEKLDYPLDTINGKVYYRYTVERSIGLYRISVNFGVTQEEILKANPQLQYQGLKYDEVILIPVKGEEVKSAETKNEEAKSKETMRRETKGKEKRNRLILLEETPIEKKKPIEKPVVVEVQDSAIFDTIAIDLVGIDTLVLVDSVQVDSVPKIDSTATRLAFLLPLHADAIKRDKNMERFYDFYAGALIAVYEAQAQGQMLEVFTYDIGKTANRTKEILQSHPEIREVDAVVGPAYSPQVSMVLDSLREDSIWMLIPFLSRVEGIDNHPNMLKFNPSEQIEADTIARYLAQKGDSINCVLVESREGEVIPATIKALHAALEREKVPTTTISLRALLIDSVGDSFRDSIENIVIFNTERYANLQTVMPHLLNICGTYRITLYSHYSWQNEKIILPQLYASVFTQEPVIPEGYQALFDQYFAHTLSSDRPRYDLLGYDLTSHLLHILHQSADSVEHKGFDDDVWQGIQANIHYQQTAPEGGYENHIMHIIHQ